MHRPNSADVCCEGVPVSDALLASAIAEELGDYLRTRAAEIAGSVYAVSLWSNPDYAELGVSIATENLFTHWRTVPRYADLPDDVMSAPSSLRWNSGDWQYCAERFVSETSQEQLNPLAAAIDEALGQVDRDPGRDNWDEVHRALRRWHVLSNEVMALAHPLEPLDCSPDSIAWVEFQSYTTPVEHAASMTRTNDASLLRRLFPHWRRLCDGLDATDGDTLARLRDFRETQPVMGIRQRYQDAPILTPDLERLLSDCGFTWWDLAGWDGARIPSDFEPHLPNYGTCEPVALAFVVADRIG